MGNDVNDVRDGLEEGFPKELFSFTGTSVKVTDPKNDKILAGYGRVTKDYVVLDPESSVWMVFDPTRSIGLATVIDLPPFFSSGAGLVTVDFYKGKQHKSAYDGTTGTEYTIENPNEYCEYTPTMSKWFVGIDEPTGTFTRTGGSPVGFRTTNQNIGGTSDSIDHLSVKNTQYYSFFKITNHSDEKTYIGWKYLFYELTPRSTKLERIVV